MFMLTLYTPSISDWIACSKIDKVSSFFSGLHCYGLSATLAGLRFRGILYTFVRIVKNKTLDYNRGNLTRGRVSLDICVTIC